jgi:hypothetical protein
MPSLYLHYDCLLQGLRDLVYLSRLSGNLHLALTISTQCTAYHQRSASPVPVKLQKVFSFGIGCCHLYSYGQPQFNGEMALFVHRRMADILKKLPNVSFLNDPRESDVV